MQAKPIPRCSVFVQSTFHKAFQVQCNNVLSCSDHAKQPIKESTMTIKRLMLDLCAFAITVVTLFFLLPLALNVANTFVNAMALAVIIGLVVGGIAVFHNKVTSKK